MDNETPEMEAITDEMRQIMRAWIEQPDNQRLKQRYEQLQTAYQKAFLEHRRRGDEDERRAVHQAYS